MDKHNISYAFTRFLKESGTYTKFIKNRGGVYKTKWCLKRGDFPSSALRYISGAFNWSNTPEKHNFWSAINVKWVSVYIKLKDHT